MTRALLAGSTIVLIACGGSVDEAQESSQAVAAQTKEDRCSSLKAPGVTPGLHGLCTAYCEAMDCAATSDDPAGKCRVAGSRLLTRYATMKVPADPPMPCVPLCPCWTHQELRQLGSFIAVPPPQDGYWQLLAFFDTDYTLQGLREIAAWREDGNYILSQADAFAVTEPLPYGRRCGFDAVTNTNNSEYVSRWSVDRWPLTNLEFDACRSELGAQYSWLLSRGVPLECTINDVSGPCP